MKFTLPFETTDFAPGERFQLHEPTGKEQVIVKVTREQRQSKVVTIVETVPFDEWDECSRVRP